MISVGMARELVDQDPEKLRPNRPSCDPTTRGVMTITCFPSRLSRVRVPSPAPRNLTYLYHFYPHRHCSRFVETSRFDGRFHELLISRHKAKAARETRTTGSIRRTLAISARYRKALIGKITRPGTPAAPGMQHALRLVEERPEGETSLTRSCFSGPVHLSTTHGGN
jgi:hypothetical protein